jgi:prepilin-type N-terminal cleavage/methylation domain-containing protein
MARILHRRAGMTLVELLVVVAIIGLLAVTVLPNVASTAESRRSREAARVASTFVARAQSRAIGRPEWAGVSFVRPPTNANATFAIDLFQSSVPQVYRGESTGSSVTIPQDLSNPLFNAGFKRSVAWSDGSPLLPAARNVTDGDLIRFNGSGPWYEITDRAASVQLRGANGFGSAAELSGQTERNTPWPTLGVAHAFEILRQPVRSGQVFTIPDGRCVDLAWSGYGNSTYNRFMSPGTPISAVTVLFDATGRVRQIFTESTATDGSASSRRQTFTGPVFLLVGRVDRATNNPWANAGYDPADDSTGFNWQYGDSYWIGIDPASGIVKTAECMPIRAAIDVTNATALADSLEESQRFIRSEITAGGR